MKVLELSEELGEEDLEACIGAILGRVEALQAEADRQWESRAAAPAWRETRYGLWKPLPEGQAGGGGGAELVEAPPLPEELAYRAVLQRGADQQVRQAAELDRARVCFCEEKAQRVAAAKQQQVEAEKQATRDAAGRRYEVWLAEEAYGRLVLRVAAMCVVASGLVSAQQVRADFEVLLRNPSPCAVLPECIPDSPNARAAVAAELLQEADLVDKYRRLTGRRKA